MRAFAFADEGESEGIHHISKMIALGSHPVEDDRFCALRAEVGERTEHLDKLCEDGGGIFFPAFLDVLFGVGRGCYEEEFCLIPEVGNEIDASLHE